MDRVALGTIFLAVACRSSEPSPEPTRAPEDIEARAKEIKGRLLAECKGGDESACRRLRMSQAAETEESSTPDGASQAAASTLEIDTWPGGATGLVLGSTPAEAATHCSRMGGTVVMLRSDQTPVARPEDIDDGGTIVCMGRRKFDPLHREGTLDAFLLLTSETAMVNFCLLKSDLTACAIHLDFADTSTHFASELRRKLEQQYGPMDPSAADFNCRAASDRDVSFRGMWLWATTSLDDSGRPFPVGALLLNYGCTPVVERPEVFFVLRDTLGMFRVLGQLQGGRIVDDGGR